MIVENTVSDATMEEPETRNPKISCGSSVETKQVQSGAFEDPSGIAMKTSVNSLGSETNEDDNTGTSLENGDNGSSMSSGRYALKKEQIAIVKRLFDNEAGVGSVDHLKTVRQNYITQFRVMNGMSSHVAALEKRLDNTRKSLEQEQKSSNSLRDFCDELKRNFQEYKLAHSSIEDARNKHEEDILKRIDSLQSNIAVAEESNKVIAELQQRVHQLEESLRESLDSCNKVISAKDAEYKLLAASKESAFEELKARLTKQQLKASIAEDKLLQSETMLKSLLTQVDLSKQLLSQYETQNTSVKEMVKKYEGMLADMQSKLKDCARQRDICTEQKNELAQRLTAQKTKHTAVLGELKAKDNLIGKKNLQVDKLKALVRKLMADTST